MSVTKSTVKESTPSKTLPAHLQFTAGGIAGVTEILVMYPLDVVKTRFQLQIGKGTGPDAYTSIADTFRKMIQKEGLGTLYRGILAPVLVEAPKRATKFGANELFGRVYKDFFGLEASRLLSVATGVSAGILEAILIVSFELVKIQMQDRSNVGLYKNSFDVVKKIYSVEGIRGFSRGLEATMWRHSVWNGVYFGLIATVRKAMPEAQSSKSKTFNNFIAGAVGGILATTVNTPFDVIKSRIQGQKPGCLHPKYSWTLSAMRTIAIEEGVSALYKGYTPKVLRLGPGGGILLVVYDQVTLWMRNALKYDME